MLKHKSKNGQVKLIAEMDDSHLKNTINFHIDKLQMAKSVLRNDQQDDEFFSSLYGSSFMNINDAKNITQNFEEKISGYIYEATLRQLNINTEMGKIRTALERKEDLNHHTKFLPVSPDMDISDDRADAPFDDRPF